MAAERNQQEPPDEKQPRSRQILDLSPDVRRALHLRSLRLSLERRRRVGMSEAADELLREQLSEELSQLQEDKAQEKPRRKRS